MICPRWKDQYNYGDSVGLRVMIVPKLKGELHILIFPSILTPESMTRDDFDPICQLPIGISNITNVHRIEFTYFN